jgi:hypothetical protein
MINIFTAAPQGQDSARMQRGWTVHWNRVMQALENGDGHKFILIYISTSSSQPMTTPIITGGPVLLSVWAGLMHLKIREIAACIRNRELNRCKDYFFSAVREAINK